jgi:hypothetical protein
MQGLLLADVIIAPPCLLVNPCLFLSAAGQLALSDRPTPTFDVSLYTSFSYKCETMFRVVQLIRRLCGNNSQKPMRSAETLWAKERFFHKRMNIYAFILTNIR